MDKVLMCGELFGERQIAWKQSEAGGLYQWVRAVQTLNLANFIRNF